MDFTKYISTPKETAETNPLVTTIKLTKGRLTGGFLYFPAGAAGTLHFLARVGVHQIIPYNTGENIRLDACVLQLSLGVDLLEPPFVIDCVTWNDSTEYAHVLTVGFSLQPKRGRKYDNIRIAGDFSGTEVYRKP